MVWRSRCTGGSGGDFLQLLEPVPDFVPSSCGMNDRAAFTRTNDGINYKQYLNLLIIIGWWVPACRDLTD